MGTAPRRTSEALSWEAAASRAKAMGQQAPAMGTAVNADLPLSSAEAGGRASRATQSQKVSLSMGRRYECRINSAGQHEIIDGFAKNPETGEAKVVVIFADESIVKQVSDSLNGVLPDRADAPASDAVSEPAPVVVEDDSRRRVVEELVEFLDVTKEAIPDIFDLSAEAIDVLHLMGRVGVKHWLRVSDEAVDVRNTISIEKDAIPANALDLFDRGMRSRVSQFWNPQPALRGGVTFERHLWDGENPTGGSSHGIGFAISWQDGPRGKTVDGQIGPQRGAFVEDVMEAVIGRLKHFEASKFKHEANAAAIFFLQLALASLDRRMEERLERGVLGTHQA